MSKAKVSRYKDPKRPELKWKVRYTNAEGDRDEKRFKIKGEAEVFRDLVNAEGERIGVQARDLSDSQRIEAAKCFKMLPEGYSLTQAVEELLARLAKTERSCTVEDAVADLLERKKRIEVERNKSPRYVWELKSQLKPFVATFGMRVIRSIEADELSEWIEGRNLGAKSFNNCRCYLSVLWSHAISCKWASENPVKEIESEESDSPPAGVLTPAAMCALIKTAKARFPALLPGLLMQGFAGLRDAEVRRLTWAHVNLEDGHIEVSAQNAKTRTRRVIDITPNLTEFLKPYVESQGKVTTSCHRKNFVELRKSVIEAGHEWPKNALRHSFVSYRLTETSDEMRTALEAGHTVDMLHRHYKGLVTKKAATEWWSIVPKSIETDSVADQIVDAAETKLQRKRLVVSTVV